MTLIITSRLCWGVRVGDVEISLELSGKTDRTGKPRWRYWIDFPDGRSYHDDDLAGRGDARSMTATLLSFLGACAESRSYGRRAGSPGENADLFPDWVGEWAEQFSDELTMLGIELEES